MFHVKHFVNNFMHLHIEQAVINLITQCEGFRQRVYICPAGQLTIGYGHVLKSGEAFAVLSETEARKLLHHDLAKVRIQVAKLVSAELTWQQEGALLSFTYNLGAGALQRSSLRQKINRQEHQLALEEFGKWVWAGGRKLPGLITRRALEAALYARHF